MKPHIRFFPGLLSLICLFAASWQAQAEPQEEAIGYVKTVTGEAWVSNAGRRIKAQPGTAVLLGSQLKTSASGTLGVTFKDNTVMSFGPDTELTVDEYLYEPTQEKLRLGSSMSKGTLNYVSGMIAKLKPESVNIKTPSGIVGVRGTQFLLQVDDAR